jgi:metal transporter CNNM
MAISKNPEEQKIAKTILAVIKDHHLFLCTLLLYNAIALESLPLIIHTLMPDWAAILFSTIFVLIGA